MCLYLSLNERAVIFVYMLFIISWYVISNVEYVLILNIFNFIIEVFYFKIIYL